MEYEEFKKRMKSARNSYVRAEVKMNELLSLVKSEFPNIELEEIGTTAENADNVEEAICCYLHYGESSPEEIWDDILLGQLD